MIMMKIALYIWPLLVACVPCVDAFTTLLQSPFITLNHATKPIPFSTQQQQQRSSHSMQLFMGWGLPEPIWRDVVSVDSVQEACPSGKYVYMKLAVAPEITQDYVTPGQFVQIKPSGNDESIKPVFLAICSPPRSENATFEFLVKKTDDNMWLTSPSSLSISQVMGNGYKIAENLDGFKYDFPTQNVILCAAGSGIAPIVSAIESGQLGISPETGRTCRLYYGERTADDLCFVEKYAEWESAGIELVPVLSQPEKNDEPWGGRTGYVQTALSEDGVPVPRNTGALVCGMKGMADSVKDILVNAGVFDGRVLFNF